MSCPSAEQLATLAEGSHDGALTRHVETCEACREVLRIVQRDASVGEGSGPVATRPSPGDTIGRYVVLRVVARGGMGEVFLGYDPILDRNLALKLTRADRSSPGFAARLEDEAQVLAKLAHPNVVRVFDAGTWRGIGYVVMEYLDGESARAWCKTRTRTTAEIIRVFAGAARGIGAAHALGIVHRDIKPDNILVGPDGAGRIADFGLVGALGTHGYRAPEVVAGAAGDARSDQWSLCAGLWEMLSGELPGATLRPVRGVSSATLRALRCGLDVDPARRFATMEELASALVPRRRETRVVLGVALIAVLAIAGWTMLRGEPPEAACDREGRAAISDAAPLEGDAFRHRFDMFGTAAELRRDAFARELDSYKTRLGASAIGACRARKVNPTAARLQSGCVAERRRELAALAGALRTADRAGLEESGTALAKLPDPALCDDPARLATVIPIDPASVAEADRIGAEVATLRARWLLGERGDIVERARELADRGERLGATVAVTTNGLYADMLADRGELTDATDAQLATARAAARAHDDRALALRLIRAAEIAAVDLAFDRASGLLASAEIIADRLSDRSLRDDLDAAKAELAIQRGDAAKAVAITRALVPRLRDRLGRTSPDTLNATYQLARALFAAKQLDESREVARTALADITASRGADDPDAVEFHNHLGKIAAGLGQLDEARQAFERALAITRATYGDTQVTADALSNLAALLVLQDRSREAAELGRQAVAIGEKLNSRKLHLYLSQLATAYLDAGNAKDGVPLMQRALALREELFGADSPELIKPLLALGLAAVNADDLDAARTQWRRAVAILTQMQEPPAFGIDLMRDLASIEHGAAQKQLLADADGLERRMQARAKLRSER
jgi:eukaryotic-like serine/threonine-protein kinase